MAMDSGEPSAVSASQVSNLPTLSVGELSNALKRTIEQAYGYVRVRGEISGCKRHGSGHVYLGLKDPDAVLDAVIWRGTASRLDLRPEDGLEVICTGRLTTFPGRSKYQLIVERMELAGEGALLKLLEDRKKRLAAEGLFDAERKRPLPYLPETIGVVTSPTGAVIRDILHRLDDRFPRRVLVWPVAVQGVGAAEQIAAAIDGFSALSIDGSVPRPDLIIVARGGGSLEDLMPFNEEIVVRATARSVIPLISAVGHETDTTLIDLAADRRAPTPTAAAEIAVPVRLELMAGLTGSALRLANVITRMLDERRRWVEGLARGLPEPGSLLDGLTQRLDDRAERLTLGWRTLLRERTARLAEAAAKLTHPRDRLDLAGRQLAVAVDRLRPAVDRIVVAMADTLVRFDQVLAGLSPDRVLERGYAVVEHSDGRLADPLEIATGTALNLRFADAVVPARALGPAQRGNSTPAPKAPVRSRRAKEQQHHPTLL
jgi:exodeoxyribonuclease VII large subunit